MNRYVVPFDLGYFELIPRAALSDDSFPVPDGLRDLVAPSGDGVQIRTGAWLGAATVEVTSHASEPPLLEGWDDRAECSATFVRGDLVLTHPWRETDDLPSVARDMVGPHRVRVYASGRTIAEDGVTPDPSAERYLIQLWRPLIQSAEAADTQFGSSSGSPPFRGVVTGDIREAPRRREEH